MADPNQAGSTLADLQAELERRGLAVPKGTAPAAAPAAPAQVPAVDAMGNVTGGDSATVSAPASDPVGAATTDIAKGLAVEGVPAAIRGVSGAVKETGDLINEAVGGAGDLARKAGVPDALVRGFEQAHAAGPLGMGATAAQWLGGKVQGIFDKPETVTGGLVEGVSQFLTGMLGPGKVFALERLGAKTLTKLGSEVVDGAVKHGWKGRMVEGMAKGAIADFTVFDGAEARLSNLVEEHTQLLEPVTSFLAARPDDNQALGRMKNAVEGLMLGPAADLFLLGVAKLKMGRILGTGADASTTTPLVEQAEEVVRRLRESGAASPEDIKHADEIVREMRAWHGSPYEFDKMEYRPKTGEGSEAFGAGGYVADAQGVATYYRDLGISEPREEVAKAVANSGNGQYLSDRVVRLLEDDEALNDLFDKAVMLHGKPGGAEALKELQAKLPEGQKSGHLYEVKVKHGPDEFLHWDEKFSEQPAAAKAKLEAVAKEHGIEIGLDPKRKADLEAELARLQRELDSIPMDGPKGWNAYSPQAEAVARPLIDSIDAIKAELKFADPTGEQIYRALSDTLGGDDAASQALKEAGLPGHRFLDQNSRGSQVPEMAHEVLQRAGGDVEQAIKLVEETKRTGSPNEAELRMWDDVADFLRGNDKRTRNTVVYDPENSVEILTRNGEQVGSRKAANEGLDAAPYSTDLKEPGRVDTGPLTFKAGDVLPKTSKEMTEATQAALDARFAVAGEEMVRTGGKFNFRTLNGPEDVKAALNAITAAAERMIEATRGGAHRPLKETLKDAEDFADTMMTSRDALLVVMGNDAKTVLHLDARLHAYKQFMLQAVDDAAEAASRALSLKGQAGAAQASAEAMHSATIASQIVSMVKGIETNVARTMSAQRLVKQTDPRLSMLGDYTQLAEQLAKGTIDSGDEKLLRSIAGLKDNPKGFVKFMERTFGQRTNAAFNEWYLNALLSGPKTHVANFLSNTLMTAYRPMERAVAGAFQWNDVGPRVAFQRMTDEYHGLMISLFDAMKVSGTAFKMNQSMLDPHNGKHLDPTGANIGGLSARNFGLTHDFYDASGKLIRTETTPILSSLADGIQTVVGIPSRLLTTSDEFFKQINYRSYLYADAAQEARAANLSPGTREFADFVAEKMTQGFDGPGLTGQAARTDIGKEALQASREATFTQDLEYGISRWLQGATNEHPIAKLVVPFVRTPVNLFRFAWKRTPIIQFAEEGFRKDFFAGGERAAKAKAQMVMGGAMFGMAAFLAYNDIITGSLSVNPEIRKGQEATGMKEYAIKIGDEYFQYNRLDPQATILGLAADFVTAVSHIGKRESEEIAYGYTMALAKNLSSKTYVQGLTNMFNAFGDAISGRSDHGLRSFVNRTVSSVAVPSILNAAKNDELLREARSVGDAIKARLPGYSKDVPPVRNFLGQVVEAPKGLGPDFASPIGYSRAKHDPVYDELAAIMTESNHPLSRIMPQFKGTKIDLRDVKLETGQSAYDRLQQLLWESGVYDSLKREITGPAWKSMQSGSLDYEMSKGSKLWTVNYIVQKHKDVARDMLLAESPKLLAMYQGELGRSKSEGTMGAQPRVYQPPGFLSSVFGNQ